MRRRSEAGSCRPVSNRTPKVWRRGKHTDGCGEHHVTFARKSKLSPISLMLKLLGSSQRGAGHCRLTPESISMPERRMMLDTRGRRTRECEDRGQHRSAEHGSPNLPKERENKLATVHTQGDNPGRTHRPTNDTVSTKPARTIFGVFAVGARHIISLTTVD